MQMLYYSVLVLGLFNIVIGQEENIDVPCPDLFAYRRDNDLLPYGIISAPLPSGVKAAAVVLTANFTVAIQLPTNYQGRLQRLSSTDNEKTVEFKVHFPVTSPLPQLTIIDINGRLLCYGPGDEPEPGRAITAISLRSGPEDASRSNQNFGDERIALRNPEESASAYEVNPPPPYEENPPPPYEENPSPTYEEDPRPVYDVDPPPSRRRISPYELNPAPAYGDNRLKPNKPVYSVEPVETLKPNKPVYSEEPVESLKPNKPAYSEEPVESLKPNKPAYSVEPLAANKPVYSVQPVPTRRPVYSVDPPPNEPPPLRPLDPSAIKCGVIAGGNEGLALVFKGQVYNRGDWPWVVALYKQGTINPVYTCSGTLVSRRHVVSAAHCIFYKGILTPPTDMLVRIGVHKLNNWAADGIAISMTTSTVEMHESYDSFSLKNDIMIMILDKPVQFGYHIRPACVWYSNPDVTRVVGAYGVVAGWGKNEFDKGGIGEPRMARLPVVHPNTCKASHVAFHDLASETTLCAGDKKGGGPCSGDSGGGLYILDSGRWQLRGIVSEALQNVTSETCNLYQYVIFTDVAQYQPWLRKKLGVRDLENIV